RPKEKRYGFDAVFGEDATQIQVYEHIAKPLIDDVISKGSNATVFAYGATGSGKTFTMQGTDINPGISPRLIRDLFERIRTETHNDNEFHITFSYLEIYNENIRDLLSGDADYLELREDPVKGAVVSGITKVEAKTVDEVLSLLEKGNQERTTESTGANSVSSRSHAILEVVITHRFRQSNRSKMSERIAKLSLIDLAGSERAAATQNYGIRMVEGSMINRSLLALGNCINALANQGNRKYVNYRDSKMTRLLKDSLSGNNCRTVMVANISPSSTTYEETMNTLKYADRAKSIKIRAS
ncbi:kinesin motor domain-containing protein, partial [Paraphysoderma sedebokerense]